MVELPRIGESLDPGTTLEVQARGGRVRGQALFCLGPCRQMIRHPNGEMLIRAGFDVRRQWCWFCSFPRKDG